MHDINYDEIEETSIYSYVANHYWEMSKDQLASFCKELDYAITHHYEKEYGIEKGKKYYEEEIQNAVIEELKENEV